MAAVMGHADEIDDDLLGIRPRWHHDAACADADPNLFFTERGESTKPAKQLCELCPVRSPCLEVGLFQRFGIWGGKSERERRRLRRVLGIRLVDASGDNTDDDDMDEEEEDEWQ